jgi:3-oxoacyl-[acyl-carrier-protein] synthase-3
MAILTFSETGIKGLSAAVPKRKIENLNFTKHFPKDQVKEVVDKTGVLERRWAPGYMTASDLCFAAAEQLISDLNISKNEIGALLFVSQTPDYRMPATSISLQNRLGLEKTTMALDINLGCSGFVYGLSVAYSLIQQERIKYVLLLDGETRTKQYSFKDRTTGFIFGDGGVAAIIEKDTKYGNSFFSLGSDGSKGDLIKIESGGYRNPSSVESVTEKIVDDYGNIRTDEQGAMNGPDVFNFVIKEVPKNIKGVMEMANLEHNDIDHFVFHQANSFMNGYLAKKLKLDTAKVPASIHKFGNTSSVSIPITIVSELKKALEEDKKLLLCGFGVGMSWASAILNFVACHISDIVEVE